MKACHEHAIHAVLLGHPEQCVKMGLVRMDATVGDESKEMQSTAAGACIFHCAHQGWIRKEIPVLDHRLNPRAVHVHIRDRRPMFK